jgi:hypothetical protein
VRRLLPEGAAGATDGQANAPVGDREAPDAPGVELMLHAWEGGSGLPDCLCCAREFVEREEYVTFLSVACDPPQY